jgi:hypothetical protein
MERRPMKTEHATKSRTPCCSWWKKICLISIRYGKKTHEDWTCHKISYTMSQLMKKKMPQFYRLQKYSLRSFHQLPVSSPLLGPHPPPQHAVSAILLGWKTKFNTKSIKTAAKFWLLFIKLDCTEGSLKISCDITEELEGFSKFNFLPVFSEI